MIRKFLICLFACLFIVPAMANVQLTTDAVRTAVANHIDSDKQVAVVNAIVSKINANRGAGINARELADICISYAGWNQAQLVDKCTKFVQDLLNASTVEFYHVCLQDVHPEHGGGAKCYDDFKDVEVDRRSAYLLAKDLIYHKNPNEKVYCAREEKNWLKHNNDDFIPCTSKLQNYFYEVKFDDAKESNDNKRRSGVVKAVCTTFNNVGYDAGGCTPGGSFGGSVCRSAACETSDATKCNKINNDLSEFGFAAKLNGGRCEILFNTIRNASDLKNPFKNSGIDSFAFCRDIQIAANISLDSQVVAYVRTKMNVTSFSCKKADVPYTGGGCTTKFGNPSDDVLRCTVNGQEVDFVFDDLSETNKTISQGGYQGLSCIASDGSFDGKRCMGVNEQACQLVKQASASTCPECKEVYWDADNNLCILPSSASATNLQKGIKVGGTVVIVAAATAVTVFSGGTAAPGAWAVVSAVGSGLTIAGGTAVIASEVATTYLVYTDEFASNLNKCLNSSDVQCAKNMLQNNLQKMVSYEKNLTDAEKKTLDESFAKLFAKIPVEDEFWDWLHDPNMWNCDSNGNCTIKQKTQFWQSVRTSGSIAMILGGTLKSFAQIASTMTRTTEVIQGIGNARKEAWMEFFEIGEPPAPGTYTYPEWMERFTEGWAATSRPSTSWMDAFVKDWGVIK